MRYEAEAIQATENEDYDEALALFQKSIDTAPGRAAPYNNRAQAYRLIENDEGKIKNLFP